MCTAMIPFSPERCGCLGWRPSPLEKRSKEERSNILVRMNSIESESLSPNRQRYELLRSVCSSMGTRTLLGAPGLTTGARARLLLSLLLADMAVPETCCRLQKAETKNP